MDMHGLRETRMADESNTTADDLLGGSTRGPSPVLLRYLPEAATEDQKERARQSALWQRGDMRLVWISEGDLATLAMTGKAVSYGKR